MNPSFNANSEGPKSLICYLCGKQFMLTSYTIHIKHCSLIFTERESTKPKAHRKPLPPPPPLYNSVADHHPNAKTIQEFNTQAFQSFQDFSLIKCSGCGRKFNESAYETHSKKCAPEEKKDAPAISRPKSISCYIWYKHSSAESNIFQKV